MKKTVKISLLLLRIFIGWHFLYEGLIKLVQGGWSSEASLKGSYGFLSGFYHWLASDPGVVQVIDFMNIWGMILIGSGLFLGIFIRISAVSGVILLALYYFAYPPFGAAFHGLNLDGHFWIINRNLIEIFALLILYNFPVSDFSLMNTFSLLRSGKGRTTGFAEQDPGTVTGRRKMLKGLAALPFFGGMMIGTVSRVKNIDLDALSGATVTRINSIWNNNYLCFSRAWIIFAGNALQV